MAKLQVQTMKFDPANVKRLHEMPLEEFQQAIQAMAERLADDAAEAIGPNVGDVAALAHNNAVEKGFWNKYRHNSEPHSKTAGRIVYYLNVDQVSAKLALIHSEVSEALEDVRDDNMQTRYLDKVNGAIFDKADGIRYAANKQTNFAELKPVGFASELADVVIRALETGYALGYDMQSEIEVKMRHNATRPHMHGKNS